MPLKTKYVNIGTEAEPKFMKIGDYWDDATIDKVAELLLEYQDIFPTKFLDLRKLNDSYVHDPFMTPFTDEVLDNVGGK